MKIGFVGLGRMGAAISQRLRQQGFDVAGWDHNADTNRKLAADGLCVGANARSVAADESRRDKPFSGRPIAKSFISTTSWGSLSCETAQP